jgi:hypothetical protein
MLSSSLLHKAWRSARRIADESSRRAFSSCGRRKAAPGAVRISFPQDTCFHHARQTPYGRDHQRGMFEIIGRKSHRLNLRHMRCRAPCGPRQRRRIPLFPRERCNAEPRCGGTQIGAIAAMGKKQANLDRSNPDCAKRARSTTPHCRTTTLPLRERAVIKLWNESRTNRARIADSIAVGIRSRRHLVVASVATTKSGNCRQTRIACPGDIR